MKKIINIISILLVCLIISGCGLIKDDVYLVYTSDVHGNVNGDIGYAGLKSYVKGLKKESPVLLVDGGDFFCGQGIADNTKGDAIIDIMNEVGYDVATVGNNDIIYGLEQTKKVFDKAKFDLVSCNLRYIGSNEDPYTKVKPYVIKRVGGIKVAFIGIMTPEALIETDLAYRNNTENGELAIDIYTNPNDSSDTGDALYARVQEVIDEARSKADIVVALAHLGIYNRNVMNCDKFINATRGVDIVLDAHAHTDHEGEMFKNVDGEDVLYMAVGCNLDRIGVVKIKTDGTYESEFINNVTDKDIDTQSLINDLIDKYE